MPTNFQISTKIPVLFLLVVSTICSMGAVFPPPIHPTTSGFKCIAQNNYKTGVIAASSTTKGVDKSVADQLLMIKNVGMGAELRLTPCRVRAPVDQVKDFGIRIQKDYCDRVWLFPPGQVADPACDWQPDHPKENCDLLHEFLSQFKRNGWQVGVISNQEIHNQYYGNCQGLNKYPLYWYPEDLDEEQSFSTYRPFGGWIKPAKKLLEGVFVCKTLLNKSYDP